MRGDTEKYNQIYHMWRRLSEREKYVMMIDRLNTVEEKVFGTITKPNDNYVSGTDLWLVPTLPSLQEVKIDQLLELVTAQGEVILELQKNLKKVEKKLAKKPGPKPAQESPEAS